MVAECVRVKSFSHPGRMTKVGTHIVWSILYVSLPALLSVFQVMIDFPDCGKRLRGGLAIFLPASTCP